MNLNGKGCFISDCYDPLTGRWLKSGLSSTYKLNESNIVSIGNSILHVNDMRFIGTSGFSDSHDDNDIARSDISGFDLRPNSEESFVLSMVVHEGAHYV